MNLQSDHGFVGHEEKRVKGKFFKSERYTQLMSLLDAYFALMSDVHHLQQLIR